jgi:hypothetical protein
MGGKRVRSIVGVGVFLVSAGAAGAHVGFGEYAGTHAVSLVPDPRSPFVGETVHMKFYLRDLHGSLAAEDFLVKIAVQKITPRGEETEVFAPPPQAITNGIYETGYAFREPGLYRIDYEFHRPTEPDLVREAIFDIEARARPETRNATVLGLISLLVGALIGFYAKAYVVK